MTLPERILPAHSRTLRNGDKMMRPVFHSLYKQMPDGYRAELLGGIVFEPSPVSWWHGQHHIQLGFILKTYSLHIPQISVGDNTSLLLSDEDEVQPDLVLRISQDAGGRSRLNRDGYIEGAPEVVAEIAYSSRAIDLHLKKQLYKAAGVSEYIVVCLNPKRFLWFDLSCDQELPVHRSVTCSKVIPGLWINGDALLALDDKVCIKTLNKGLKSAEHRHFREKLESVV